MVVVVEVVAAIVSVVAAATIPFSSSWFDRWVRNGVKWRSENKPS